jgi:hypothetical protein
MDGPLDASFPKTERTSRSAMTAPVGTAKLP